MPKRSFLLYITTIFFLSGISFSCYSDPTPGETVYLGPLTGPGATLHPENITPNRIRYYGTDLGLSYQYDGKLQFLFGDTMATEDGEPIEASTGETFDDGFGTVELSAWPDPSLIQPGHIPLVKLGQNPGTSEMAAINPGGHAMEGFKTPVGGFSNGRHEFGIFYTYKPKGCRVDGNCSRGLTCDTGLGYRGEKFSDDKGHTFGCIDNSSGICISDTMVDTENIPIRGTGFCVDKTSSVWAPTEIGRISSIGLKLLIGIRDSADPRNYTDIKDWYTSKFSNIALRTVQSFNPAIGPGYKNQNYHPAVTNGKNRRVFIWGRPGFIGVGAKGRPLNLYFAYVDMPGGTEYTWDLHYYSGTGEDGIPRFSTREVDASALDLDSHIPGIQENELYDVVDHVSIAWVDHLKKWVMFYGGGMINLPIDPELPNCGVLELFTGPECKEVVLGNGAIHMRSADNPWGPWSPPQDIIVGGDPAFPGSGQYGIGGVLRHPSCNKPGCAPHTKARDVHEGEYGFFYGANIIEQWIKPAGKSVDIIWNASTWDPYRIILLRTRIKP